MSGSRYSAQGSGNYAAPAYHVDAHRYFDPTTGQRVPPVAEYPSGLSSAVNLNEHEPPYQAPTHRLPPIELYNDRAEGPGEFNSAVPNYDDDDHASSQGSQSRRKPKSHVDKACVYCQKKHLACDVNRPCRRCIENGVADSCHSVPHKKRGRPPHANKEGRGARSQRGGPELDQPSPISQYASPSYETRLAADPHQHMPFPILPSQSAAESYRQAYNPHHSGAAAYYGNAQYTTSPYHPAPPQALAYGHPPLEAASQSSPPIACLTIDLDLSHANSAFLKATGSFKDLRGNRLDAIVGDGDLIMLHALKAELRSSTERSARVEEIPRPEEFRTSGVDTRIDFPRPLTFKHQTGVHNAVFTVCRFVKGEFVMLSLPYAGIQQSSDPLSGSQLGSIPSPSAPVYHQGGTQSRSYATHPSGTALAQYPRYTPGYSVPPSGGYPAPHSQVPSTAYYDGAEGQRGYVADYLPQTNPSYSSSPYTRSTPR